MVPASPVLRRLTTDEVAQRVSELAALQRAAYQVEADLIGDDRIPPLHETTDDLVAAGLTWHVVEIDGRCVAALACSAVDGEIDIERLVVHPERHRSGLGRMLVAALPTSSPVVVSTGRGNHPARRLYESLGFRHVADHEVLPDLWVSEYQRP